MLWCILSWCIPDILIIKHFWLITDEIIEAYVNRNGAWKITLYNNDWIGKLTPNSNRWNRFALRALMIWGFNSRDKRWKLCYNAVFY